jgi:inward rectifier potassium channel
MEGLPKRPLSDLYHLLLTISWARIIFLLVGTYIIINAGFACLYLLDAGGLENAEMGSFSDAFFFSVQTMATIGYGKMVPRSMFANSLVTIEALVGMLSTAMATGLMFSKFSRPTARILFSRNLVIADRDGVPSLALRVANERGNQVVEAQMRLVLLRTEVTQEGERVRRVIDLKLARPQTAVFALSWTAYHPITPDSPIYGETAESLKASHAEFLAAIVGIDESFSQTVHARHNYFDDELLWGARFVDIMAPGADGKNHIDYTRFHDTQPATLTALASRKAS